VQGWGLRCAPPGPACATLLTHSCSHVARCCAARSVAGGLPWHHGGRLLPGGGPRSVKAALLGAKFKRRQPAAGVAWCGVIRRAAAAASVVRWRGVRVSPLRLDAHSVVNERKVQHVPGLLLVDSATSAQPLHPTAACQHLAAWHGKRQQPTHDAAAARCSGGNHAAAGVAPGCPAPTQLRSSLRAASAALTAGQCQRHGTTTADHLPAVLMPMRWRRSNKPPHSPLMEISSTSNSSTALQARARGSAQAVQQQVVGQHRVSRTCASLTAQRPARERLTALSALTHLGGMTPPAPRSP
jgi:hypothetical protein